MSPTATSDRPSPPSPSPDRRTPDHGRPGRLAQAPEIAELALALHPASELRVGPDGKPFLLNHDSGGVVALHGPGGRIVEMLDGTRSLNDLTTLFGLENSDQSDPRRVALHSFVGGLHTAGMLAHDTEDLAENAVAVRVDEPAFRYEYEHIPREMPPGFKARFHLRRQQVSTRDEHVPTKGVVWALLGAVFALGAIGHVKVVQTFLGDFTGFADLPDRAPGVLLLILPILVTQIALHEASHALALRLFGLQTREVGVRFWFYFMPVPFVSQAAEIFLPQRRQRIVVALAGIISDGITALAILAILPRVASGAFIFTWALTHLMVLHVNLNPFLPTDGARAVEAALGEVSLRQRSVRWARCKVLRTPPPPGSPSTWGKQLYGVASMVFVAALVVLITVQIGTAVLQGV